MRHRLVLERCYAVDGRLKGYGWHCRRCGSCSDYHRLGVALTDLVVTWLRSACPGLEASSRSSSEGNEP